MGKKTRITGTMTRPQGKGMEETKDKAKAKDKDKEASMVKMASRIRTMRRTRGMSRRAMGPMMKTRKKCGRLQESTSCAVPVVV